MKKGKTNKSLSKHPEGTWHIFQTPKAAGMGVISISVPIAQSQTLLLLFRSINFLFIFIFAVVPSELLFEVVGVEN